MKLQKHLAYKYKNKKYYKHIVVVPEETVEKLGWNKGVELQPHVNGNNLILKPKNMEERKKEET